MCANIKVRNNNIRECAPFAKFTKIIDREHFATYGMWGGRAMWGGRPMWDERAMWGGRAMWRGDLLCGVGVL